MNRLTMSLWAASEPRGGKHFTEKFEETALSSAHTDQSVGSDMWTKTFVGLGPWGRGAASLPGPLEWHSPQHPVHHGERRR